MHVPRKNWPLVIGLNALLLCSVATAAEPAREEGTLPTGFPYQMTMPENWNGIVINDLDAVANAENDLTAYLLAHGYAYIGTGRHPERMTRHDPLTELDAQVAVIDMFTAKYGEPKQTIQYGCSGGGFVALAMAETHPDKIDGAVSFNARGTGGMAVANTWLDLPFALKSLLAPESGLLVAPVPESALPAAYDEWKAVMEAAQATPEGQARIALAVALAQWPTWGAIYSSPERPADGNLDALQQAMFVSASDGLRNAVTRRQLYDNPKGLASWNTGIDYAHFYEVGADPAQKKIVEQLYERAGLGAAEIAEDLKRIDAQPRLEGTPDGVHYWLEPGRLLDGQIGVPLLHVHGLGDALLPPHLTAGYGVAIERAGTQDMYRQGFIDAPGHCVTNVPEAVAAIETVLDRLNTGKWSDTSSEALNERAKAIAADASPRYVSHVFATPFDRAFYKDSAHPF